MRLDRSGRRKAGETEWESPLVEERRQARAMNGGWVLMVIGFVPILVGSIAGITAIVLLIAGEPGWGGTGIFALLTLTAGLALWGGGSRMGTDSFGMKDLAGALLLVPLRPLMGIGIVFTLLGAGGLLNGDRVPASAICLVGGLAAIGLARYCRHLIEVAWGVADDREKPAR